MKKDWIIVAHDSYSGRNYICKMFSYECEVIEYLSSMIEKRIEEYKKRVMQDLCQEILITPLNKFKANNDDELLGTLQFQNGEVVDYTAIPMDNIKEQGDL